MTREFNFTSEDFLAGRFDQLFRVANSYNGGAYNKYVPINNHALSYQDLDQIWINPTFSHILAIWTANIGANGRKFVINLNKNNNETTKKTKENYAKRMYNFLYTKKDWASLEKKIIAIVAREGSCILMPSIDDEIQVYSLRRFNVYHDNITNKTRYAYLDDTGREIEGLKNLTHKKDLYHIKDPAFEDWVVPPSRIDCALLWILLQNHGLKSNNYLFSNAFIGTTLLSFSEEGIRQAEKVPDKQGKSYVQRLLDRINSIFAGGNNSFRVGSAFGLEKVFELGKNNKDLQFLELLKTSKTEILSAYSLTMSDVGDGDKGLTYNNASTFSYNVYGKIGRQFEEILDQVTNDWFLPYYGIQTTEYAYFDYNKPSNPDRLALEEQTRKNWQSNTITLNEMREVLGLDTIENGNVFYKDWVVETTIDTVEVGPKEKVNGFFTKKVYARKTPTEKALESVLYLGDSKKKGFLKRWIEAIEKQANDYIRKFQKLKDDDVLTLKVELTKIETFYSFPALKKDLLSFAGLALDDVKADKRTKFSVRRDYFDGEYPQAIIDNIDQYTEALLKGNDLFDTIDIETTSQIQNIIKENASSGVFEITKILEASIPNLAIERAKLIAQTSVAEAVEKTREILYLQEFPKGSKSWQTAVTDVCVICEGNERQGKIKIDKVFSSGVSAPSAHPNCKCTALYYEN